MWVPDATMDAMRLPLRFFASARRNGADLCPFTEVTGLLRHGALVTGVAVHDHLSGRDADVQADLVVNATGPWCERLAGMAGADVPVRPSPGVLLALHGRLCDRVVNRLHPAGDGDIVLPQRALSVVGTSAWVVTDPDDLDVPEEHVQAMYGRAPGWSPQSPPPASGPPGRRPGRWSAPPAAPPAGGSSPARSSASTTPSPMGSRGS